MGDGVRGRSREEVIKVGRRERMELRTGKEARGEWWILHIHQGTDER